MSSDEKALKIEKVYSQYGFGPDASNILNTEKTLDIIIEAVNELLDTHTVKEEKEILLGEDKSDGVHVKLFGYRKDGHVYITREEVKEEPTTPEKKCCSIDGKNGYHSLLCSRPDLKKATPEKSQIDHSIFLFCRDPNCQVHQEESEKKSWCERAFGVGNCPHRGWNRNDTY